MSGTTISIIFNVFFVLVIIGLAIWIILLYRKPACVANATLCSSFCKSNCNALCPGGSCTPSAALCDSFCKSNCSTLCTQTPGNALIPYIIFGTIPVPCLTVNNINIKGVMSQDSTSLKFLQLNNGSNTSSQWYFIPTTANNILIQNVNSSGYININPTTSEITVQSGVANATPIQWIISKSSNINYFVFNTSANDCPSNLQYIAFQDDKTIKMSCIQSGVSGQWWYTLPANAALSN
jgi:hypothetical protein